MPVSDPLAGAVSPDTTWAVCLRPFDATGHQLMRGEVVNTEAWPAHRVSTMVERRYLEVLAVGVPIPAPTRVEGVNRRIIKLEDVQKAQEAAQAPATATKAASKPTPTRKSQKPKKPNTKKS